jgi:hypothetical protein
MSENPTQPSVQRPATEAEIAQDKHTQHLHRVFGADDAHRGTSQRYVVEWLEKVVKAPVFARGRDGAFCPIASALNEGQRILANQLLEDIKRDAVEVTTKPTVTK